MLNLWTNWFKKPVKKLKPKDKLTLEQRLKRCKKIIELLTKEEKKC